MFWTPAFAGVTLQETFYETINFADILFRGPGQGQGLQAGSAGCGDPMKESIPSAERGGKSIFHPGAAMVWNHEPLRPTFGDEELPFGLSQLSLNHQIRPHAPDLQNLHSPGILYPESPLPSDHPGRFLPADDLRGQE